MRQGIRGGQTLGRGDDGRKTESGIVWESNDQEPRVSLSLREIQRTAGRSDQNAELCILITAGWRTTAPSGYFTSPVANVH